MPPRRELNERFHGHIRRAQRVRVASTAFLATLTVLAVVGSAAFAFQDIAPTTFARATGSVRNIPNAVTSQLANVTLPDLPQLPALPNPARELAAAASSGYAWLDAAGDTIFNIRCPIFRTCPIAQNPSENATSQHTTSLPNVKQPASTTQNQPQNPSPAPAAGGATATQVAVSNPPTLTKQPVIERIREVQTAGINAAYVDARIAALATSVQRQFDAMADANATSFRSVSQSSGGSSPTSVNADAITGTITNAIDSAVGAILDLTTNTLTASNATFTNATTTNLEVTGTAKIGSATGVLHSSAGLVSAISTGSNGQVLKLVGGTPTWSTDLQGSGGGSSAWATSSDDLLISPSDPTDVVIVGSNATTTTGTILEVAGNSLFRGTLSSYFNVTAPRFTATSSQASILPYASSTALTVSGTGYFGSASTSALTISNSPGGILKTDSAGNVSVATAGSDYLNSTSGDWSGTLGGFTTPQLLAAGFSTTSADVWKSNRNFFATTSADYWKTQTSFFATTSSDFWISQRTTDNLTQGSSNLYWSNTLFDARLAATTSLPNVLTLGSLSLPATQLTNFGTPFFQYFSATTTTALAEGSNLYFTNARADARINATSSIGTLSSAPNLGTIATSLTGFLKATAGVLSAALVDLASNVTGILPVANGGTGWSNLASGAVVLGNGTGAVATTSAGTDGQVLALVGGIPSWVATSTLLTISGTLSGTQLDGVFSSNGLLARTTTGTYASRTLTGTSNQITVTNGDGVSGNPTLSLPSLLAFAQASSTQQSILDALYIGRTATTTIRGDGVASTIPYASSTALTVSGTASTSKFFADGLVSCASENMLTWSSGTFGCESDTSGGSSFSYLFPGNATTTGLGIYASTTIGAGGQTTGLTISGGATTTADLTVQGGDIILGSQSVFSGGDTASLNNIDALDPTTETTIEAALDTLANLTSIQGQNVTLTGAFVRSGAHSLTLTTTGTTDVTLPTTGTLVNSAVATLSSLTTVGALNSGSVTSGFGSIDIGADSLTAGGGSLSTLTVTGNASLANATSSGTMFGNRIAGSTAAFGATATSSFSSSGVLTLAVDLAVTEGGTGASSLTDHGVLVGSGASAIDALAVGTNGQLLMGSTGADPVFATLNCADALTCTTGAGTLEIDFDGGTAPGGELGGTWASPTLDAEVLGIEELSDVTSITENYGDLLGWNGSTWADFATSTLFTASAHLAGMPIPIAPPQWCAI
jgi:hypothetical protein